jgi:hypothetical protein
MPYSRQQNIYLLSDKIKTINDRKKLPLNIFPILYCCSSPKCTKVANVILKILAYC